LQVIVGEPFTSLRLQWGDIHRGNIAQRAWGLTFYYIPLSYQLVQITLLAIGILSTSKGKRSLLLGIIVLIMILGLTMTFTRSAILGISIGILVMFFYIKPKSGKLNRKNCK